MDSSVALAILREHELELRARGVRHAAVFGSVARGTQGPESDLDIMIDTDPAVPITVYDYVDLKEYISGLFDGAVDVVNQKALKPYLRSSMSDALYAF